jgi:hypothetical protein
MDKIYRLALASIIGNVIIAGVAILAIANMR